MTIQQALIWVSNKLKKSSPTSSLDAEVLLSFILNKPKEFLYTYPDKKLTGLQEKKLKELTKRRSKGEPVAYIRGFKEFYGLDFYVDKRVLIPRPETELLVEETLLSLRGRQQRPKQSHEIASSSPLDKLKGTPRNDKNVIADIGTGSGCIIIALAKSLHETCNMKHVTCYATDISKTALAVAKKNAKKHKAKIKFFHGDLLKPLDNKKIDILVANLPYVWKKWKSNASAATFGLKFEPQKALFAKENGLYLYRRLFEQIAKRKQKPELIIGEFDPRQKVSLQKLAKKYLPQYRLEIKKDLAGLNRILIIK